MRNVIAISSTDVVRIIPAVICVINDHSHNGSSTRHVADTDQQSMYSFTLAWLITASISLVFSLDKLFTINNNKLCTWLHNMPRPSPASRCRADRNIAVCSHSQYVPTLTAAAA